LGFRKVEKEGVAVIKYGVNERGCDSCDIKKVGLNLPFEGVRRSNSRLCRRLGR